MTGAARAPTHLAAWRSPRFLPATSVRSVFSAAFSSLCRGCSPLSRQCRLAPGRVGQHAAIGIATERSAATRLIDSQYPGGLLEAPGPVEPAAGLFMQHQQHVENICIHSGQGLETPRSKD